MGTSEKQPDTLESICNNLAEYAVNRDEIKELVNTMPKDQNINTVTVEYELQLLKIATIGWSVSVYMKENEKKQLFELKFWELIREYSKDISNVTSLMIGHDINYFDLIKQRLDAYIKSLEGSKNEADPASAIGPAFATICKDKENAFVVISGSRLFNYSVRATKEYLDAEKMLA
jgi:hypothetical protein